ncbi:hypothetical protein V5799_007414 [Amblyomma americanum]|uniref:Uncharacterized protein n=1 Tax=Amblyomma americanum TaxID=6943 RepID=A0AAQ4FHP1_AMBAM
MHDGQLGSETMLSDQEYTAVGKDGGASRVQLGFYAPRLSGLVLFSGGPNGPRWFESRAWNIRHCSSATSPSFSTERENAASALGQSPSRGASKGHRRLQSQRWKGLRQQTSVLCDVAGHGE